MQHATIANAPTAAVVPSRVRPARVIAAPATTPRPVMVTTNSTAAWSQAGARMLIAAFFIVSAIANLSGNGAPALELDPALQSEAAFLLNAVIYSMAFALLVGRYVHIAAITLGLIMLMSSASSMMAGDIALHDYWRDLVIVGALFALAVTQGGSVLPRAKRLVRTGNAAVVPRRVRPPSANVAMLDTPEGRHELRNHIARPVARTGFVSSRLD